MTERRDHDISHIKTEPGIRLVGLMRPIQLPYAFRYLRRSHGAQYELP
ncbi:uncharacterized protein CTRU02_209634 [Colletotrichum truncatum]|uniref:Uncharacterized protein n=1 Tax=Colletotrichum truncatum TaxID=5467 RepID=A0ACC3YSX1_COLTU